MDDLKWLTRGRLILIVGTILVVVIGIIIFNTAKNKNIKKYKEFEEEIKIEAKNYFEIKNMDIDDGEEIKIDLDKLKKQKLISNELQNKCKGYAVVTSDRDIYSDEYKITYSAYIKCGNKYQTPNYSEY